MKEQASVSTNLKWSPRKVVLLNSYIPNDSELHLAFISTVQDTAIECQTELQLTVQNESTVPGIRVVHAAKPLTVISTNSVQLEKN